MEVWAEDRTLLAKLRGNIHIEWENLFDEPLLLHEPPIKNYRHGSIGIAFDYPDDWVLDDSEPTAIWLSASFAGGVLILTPTVRMGPPALETWTDGVIADLTAQLPGLRETSRTSANGDEPKYLITAEGADHEGLPIQLLIMTGVGRTRAVAVIAFAPQELFNIPR